MHTCMVNLFDQFYITSILFYSGLGNEEIFLRADGNTLLSECEESSPTTCNRDWGKAATTEMVTGTFFCSERQWNY